MDVCCVCGLLVEYVLIVYFPPLSLCGCCYSGCASNIQVKDFKAALADGPQDFPELVQLAEEVKTFARSFPTIGF